MSARRRHTHAQTVFRRLARWTTLNRAARNLSESPTTTGFAAWARTTSSVVALLIALQLCTGLLLAFYYVPSAESAHTTVAYIEKSLGGGSWLRALHLYGSQWLPLALLLHLAQMYARGAHRRRRIAWLASLALLALTLSGGATGYSLPWDARAYDSTRIAAGITRGLPLVGAQAQLWLLGGAELSTLTLSRFYALHVLIIPLLVLFTINARLFIFRDPDSSSLTATHATLPLDPQPPPPPGTQTQKRARQPVTGAQLARHAVTLAVVFLMLAFYAARHPAPLAPPPELAPSGYLPRPGAQFLWLFQLLKYLPRAIASLTALGLPALILASLASLPFIKPHGQRFASLRRHAGAFAFGLIFLLVASLTALAYLDDARDPRLREQLARQAGDEEKFRRTPFQPQQLRPSGAHARSSDVAAATNTNTEPPATYTEHCARCHGARGEGKSINPSLIGINAQPRRTIEDLDAILIDPAGYALDPRMPSFKNKLTADERREISLWIVSLKR